MPFQNTTGGGTLTNIINKRRRLRKQNANKPYFRQINNEDTLNLIAQLSSQNTDNQIINDFFNGFS
ncbi:13697_t:CDS:1, partial [Funneliformis mosseae]